MITNYLRKGKTWLLVFLLFFVGSIDAGADIQLTDDLVLAGWLRHSMAFNIGVMNPYNKFQGLQEDNQTLNLSRTHFQAELTYTPTELFRLHSKMRVVYDQTNDWDDNLINYAEFPLPEGERHGRYLRLGSPKDDRVIAEIWEIYADLYLEDLWLRLGKQVISWGEFIGVQIMDIINPLDQTWHKNYEIEEYENIKIPLWMIRARYDLAPPATWFQDFYLEGFWNPGDTSPGWGPDPGSPYTFVSPASSLNDLPDYTRRGDDEFGIRVGGRFGQVGWTLSYLYLYDDAGQGDYNLPPGPPFFGTSETKWEKLDIYGITLNWASDRPLNLAATFEATYIPDMPYQDALVFSEFGPLPSPPFPPGTTWPDLGPPHIRKVDEWNLGLMLWSKLFLWPPGYDPLNVYLIPALKIIEDHDKVKWFPGPLSDSNSVEKISRDNLTLILKQLFLHQQLETEFKVIWFPDGAYQIKPRIAYKPGNHWRFDIYAMWHGGSAYSGDPANGVLGNPNTFAYFYFTDEIYTRITYLF